MLPDTTTLTLGIDLRWHGNCLCPTGASNTHGCNLYSKCWLLPGPRLGPSTCAVSWVHSHRVSRWLRAGSLKGGRSRTKSQLCIYSFFGKSLYPICKTVTELWRLGGCNEGVNEKHSQDARAQRRGPAGEKAVSCKPSREACRRATLPTPGSWTSALRAVREGKLMC